jgi:hypothetical protein
MEELCEEKTLISSSKLKGTKNAGEKQYQEIKNDIANNLCNLKPINNTCKSTAAST